jgi:hypothetical protein
LYWLIRNYNTNSTLSNKAPGPIAGSCDGGVAFVTSKFSPIHAHLSSYPTHNLTPSSQKCGY